MPQYAIEPRRNLQTGAVARGVCFRTDSLSNMDVCQWMNADCVRSGLPSIQRNFWTTGYL